MKKYFVNPENVLLYKISEHFFFFFTKVRISEISKIRTSGKIWTSGNTDTQTDRKQKYAPELRFWGHENKSPAN